LIAIRIYLYHCLDSCSVDWVDWLSDWRAYNRTSDRGLTQLFMLMTLTDFKTF